MGTTIPDDAFADALLKTVDLPLLALDSELRVWVVNDAFLEQFSVTRKESLGRLIYDLGEGQWNIPELRQLLQNVFHRDEVIRDYRVEHEFDRIGRRVMRLNAKRMSGANDHVSILIAFADETERESQKVELEGRVEFADKLIDCVREGLIILHWDLRVHSANQIFYDMFKVDKIATEGHLVYDLGDGQWNIPELRHLLETVLPRDQALDDYEVDHTFEGFGRRVMLLNGRRLDHLNLIVLAIRDITEQRAAEQRRIDRERRQSILLSLFDAFQTSTDANAICSLAARRLGEELAASRVLYYETAESDILVVAEHVQGVLPLTGRDLGEWADQDLIQQRGQDGAIILSNVAHAHSAAEMSRLTELQIGAYVCVPFFNAGKVIGGLAVQSEVPREWTAAEVELVREIAERTRATIERLRAELERDQSEARFRALIETSSDVVYRMSPDWDEMRQLVGREYLADTDQPNQAWLERYIPLNNREVLLSAIRAAVQSKSPLELEHRVLRKDGSIGWTLSRAVPILGADGNIAEWFGLAADITNRKAAEEAIRDREAQSRAQAAEIETIYASAHVGLCVLDRDLRFRRINAKLAEINGVPVEDHIGRTVREVLPELADAAEPIARRIIETGEPILDLELSGETPAQPGVLRTWVEQWLPLRDQDGTIIGINVAAEEVTERKRAEQQLRAAHDTFRSLVDHSPFGIYVVDADFRLVQVSDGARKAFENVRPLIGRDFSEVMRTIWPEPFASEAINRFRHTLGSGERYQSLTTIERRADTSALEAYDWRIERLNLPDGRPGVVCHFYDLSERQRHEQQLAIAAERAEIAQKAAHAMYYEFVPSAGTAIRSPAAFKALTGYEHQKQPETADWWRSIIHPEDVGRVWEEVEQGIANNTGFKIDYRIRHAQGHDVWVHDHASVIPARDGAPARVVGMVLDISEQKEREVREQLLMREVNHRAKNMLGLVHAVARQTAAGDPQTFVERFGDRIQSLAASQDLLVKSNWKNVPLESLVRSQLEHFSDLIGSRISLSGPPLAVTAAAAQTLGMAMHELGTNASKHGALSNEKGFIAVVWTITPGDNPRVSITWTESEGPPVAAPIRRGFGSMVIGDMVSMSLNGEVKLDYAATGLVWLLDCPADKVLDAGSLSNLSYHTQQSEAKAPRRERVLLVEDEALIAMEVADMLKDAGYDVLGPAMSVKAALELLKSQACDAAVLDINLGQETAAPIAQALSERGTPFLTISGYGAAQRPPEFSRAPHLDKPLRTERLVSTLKECLSAPQSHRV